MDKDKIIESTPMKDPILIVGGTSGIGSALAIRCADLSHPVYVASRRVQSTCMATDRVGVTAITMDATDSDSITSATQLATPHGRLAGLAYCPGTIDLKPLKRVSEEDLLNAFRVNVIGAVNVIQAASEALKTANGSIVLFSTIAVKQGFPNHVVIASAKGAVEALAKSLAAELAPKVRVNCIAPSLTQTPLSERLLQNETLAKGIADLHPLGRLGQADDIAALAEFLMSEKADWITGQVFGVDGGRSTLRLKA